MRHPGSDSIRELVLAVLKLEPHLREEFLKEKCGDNKDLLAAVLNRLKAEDAPTMMEVRPHSPAPEVAPVIDPAGFRIGPWQLMRVLGQGGMGAVWLAERVDGEINMRAAVKLVRPELANEDFLTRFRHERQIMADLKHPYIGTLYDAGTTEDGQLYLVMEFVEGDTINRFCQANLPELASRIQLFRKVCEAVAYAHRKGVIHRDIKPGNIMVSPEGMPKLMDFGIAFLKDSESGDPLLSKPDQVAMTPEYAAPELLFGGEAGVPSDIYALGLVLVELLTGIRPSELGRDKVKAIENHFIENPPLADLLAKMLADQRLERLASVQQLMHELDRQFLDLSGNAENAPICRYDALAWCHPDDEIRVAELVHLLEVRHSLALWVAGRDEGSLMEAVTQSSCLIACLGENVPWQNREQRSSLELLRGHRRVVPLLLSGSHRPERESSLPDFLRRRTWLSQPDPGDGIGLALLARAIRGLAVEVTSVVTIDTCPFRGLEVFREEDRRFFFGREAITQRLWEHMASYRFLSVLGPSGSGKSSVVQAGLVPHLREQGIEIVMFTPASHPLKELAFALHNLNPDQDPERVHLRLKAGDQALAFMGQQMCEVMERKGICLVIDQFEELFTLVGDSDEVNLFIASLLYAVEQENSGLSIVLTLRSDFVGRCVFWPDLNNYIIEHAVQVEPMKREELAYAISEPARLSNLYFEDGLVDRILGDVDGASAELPLLEHALLELWVRRRGRLLTQAAYAEIGGIEGALAKRAETEYQQLDEKQQKVLRKMFTLCLVHPGEGAEDTRRRATREDLLAIGGDPNTSGDLLNRFVLARLLTTQRDEGQNRDMVDVAHEALIRKWQRIREWMREDRETARQIESLRRRARAWDEAGRTDDHLLRGVPLHQMRDVAEREQGHLNHLERIYVEAGIDVERQQEEARAIIARNLRVRRNQALVAGGFAFLLAVIAFFFFLDASRAEKEARKAEQVAREQKEKAEQKTLEANYNMGLALSKDAGIAMDRGNSHEAWLLSLAALSLEIPLDRDIPEARGRFIDPRMEDTSKLLWTSPVTPKLVKVASSPDGKMLALAGEDTLIRLLDPGCGNQVNLLVEAGHNITDLSFSPDSHWLAAATEKDSIYLWDMVDGSFSSIDGGLQGPITALSFSPDSRKIGFGDKDGQVLIYTPEKQQKQLLHQFGSGIRDLVFDREGQGLYLASGDGVHFIDLASGHLKKLESDQGQVNKLALVSSGSLVGGLENGRLVFLNGGDSSPPGNSHAGPVLALAVTPDGQNLISASREKVQVWDNRLRLTRPLTGVTDVRDICVNGSGTIDVCDGNGNLLRYLINGNRLPEIPVGHGEFVWGIGFSPDGRTIASGSADGTIRLWDPTGQTPTRVLRGHTSRIYGLSFSPDGLQLASASYDQSIRLWELKSGTLVREFSGHTASVSDVGFSPDGKQLASVSEDQTVRLWDIDSGKTLKVFFGHSASIIGVAFSPDGRKLASASFDQTVRLWDLDSEGLSQILTGHSGTVYDVAFSPDGTRLATASSDQTVRIWELPTGKSNQILRGHSSTVFGLAFSPDGKRLASGSTDQTVRLWEIKTGLVLDVLRGHFGSVYGLAFSPDGGRLVSGSADQTVRMWDLDAGSPFKPLRGHSADITGVAFSPDGLQLASSSEDQTVRLWDPASGKQLKVLTGHAGDVIGVAFSPDGKTLASASFDQTVRIWSLASGETLEILRGHEDRVFDLAYSPDGELLASASWDHGVRVWDLKTGACIHVLSGHEDRVFDVAFSPDSQVLASASQDQTVRLWDRKSGALLRVLRGHSNHVNGVAFSPDGSRLASAAHDQTLRLWDTATGTLLQVLYGHTGPVNSVAFSPNGKWLVSSAVDRTIRIWDAWTGRPLAVLAGHESDVNWFNSFSPDGKLLVSAAENKTMRIWKMDRMLLAPEGISARNYYDELLRRSLYFFGYRLDGFRLIHQPHMRLYGENTQAGAYEHLDRPRPPNISLAEWLMTGSDPDK